MRRYIGIMLLLAAALALTAHSRLPVRPAPNYRSAEHRPGSLIAEATATVRIVFGARITATSQPADAQVETVELPAADGGPRISRLVEFQ